MQTTNDDTKNDFISTTSSAENDVTSTTSSSAGSVLDDTTQKMTIKNNNKMDTGLLNVFSVQTVSAELGAALPLPFKQFAEPISVFAPQKELVLNSNISGNAFLVMSFAFGIILISPHISLCRGPLKN